MSFLKSCYLADSITFQSSTDFLNFSENCRREKGVFVQRHNASLHSKLCQTALELTAKGLDQQFNWFIATGFMNLFECQGI